VFQYGTDCQYEGDCGDYRRDEFSREFHHAPPGDAAAIGTVFSVAGNKTMASAATGHTHDRFSKLRSFGNNPIVIFSFRNCLQGCKP
jgi:hypothetical protein